MRLNAVRTLVLAGTLTSAAAAINTPRDANTTTTCRDVLIPVSAKAENRDLPTSMTNGTLLEDPVTVNDLLVDTALILVEGEYTIAGSFCTPTQNITNRQNTLQILVHGITDTRTYWMQEGARSWVDYATSQGFPVLAIDRLCNGKSSHPNGLLECQLPLQAAALHGVIDAARQGEIPGADTAFSNIIYVGHSYGSLVANGIHTSYPYDINQTHLTGFTTQLIRGFTGLGVRPLFLPAALVNLGRFGSLLLDPTYTAATSYKGLKPCLYNGDYNATVAESEFENRGTLTLGELATSLLGQGEAPVYEGDLFVLNGDLDGVFCATGPVSALAGEAGRCSEGKFSQDVQPFYPRASNFDFHNLEETGHHILSHASALEAIKASHEYMARTGF